MKRFLSLATLCVSALLLAACEISAGPGGGDPFEGEPRTQVDVAEDFNDAALQNVFLESGESMLFAVDIESAVAQEFDLVYFDVAGVEAGDVVVTAFRAGTEDPLYESYLPTWFARAEDVDVAGFLQPQAIGLTNACGGPCIVLETPGGAGTAFFLVYALTDVIFDLYVVAADYADTLEDVNDRLQDAPLVGLVEQGALETVGDADWYQANQDVFGVELTTPNDALGLVADIYDESGTYLTTIDADAGPYVLPNTRPDQQLYARVYSELDRAAPSALATYTVDFLN